MLRFIVNRNNLLLEPRKSPRAGPEGLRLK